MPQKCILILLDGLGDRAHPALGDLTPLQAADTPALDSLARGGCNGLYHAGLMGQAMPSELAHCKLFGYPDSAFPGRGALEALGAGIALGESDVALMARLVLAREESGRLRLVKDTPQASPDEAASLAACLPNMEIDGLAFQYRHVRGLHGLLVIRPGRRSPSPWITDVNPIRDGAMLIEPTPLAEADDLEAAKRTARALKSYLLEARELLRGHEINVRREKSGLDPLNALATQRAGRLVRTVPFEKRYGLKGACLASGDVYRGLAAHLGLDFKAVRDTADPGRDLAERLQAARLMLKTHDFIHVHTKAPDVAAHGGDCLVKRDVIQALDRGVGTVLPTLRETQDVLVAVASDHSTPSSGGLIHSGEPVPVVLHGNGVRRDTVTRFDEISAATGGLGVLRGPELMLMILNYLDKARLLGLRDCPEPPHEAPAWPAAYQPFTVKRES